MATTDEEQRAATSAFAVNGAAGDGRVGPLGVPQGLSDAEYHDEPMTLQEHLKELRDRLIKTAIGVGVGMALGFFLAQFVTNYFVALVNRSCSAIVNGHPRCQVVALAPTEQIVVYFEIAFYIGVALAMPVIVYQLIRFLAPGLTRTEKRYVYLLMPFILIFFTLGVLFSSLVAIPNMMHFLLNFGNSQIANMISIESLLGFFSKLALWTGIMFELPLVMFALATIGVANYQFQRKTRKYAVVLLMIIAAVITPTPDPGSMLIVWAPMYALFELGLILARIATKRRDRRLAAKPAA